ncbi:MAG: peptide chain release factor 1 [candidate division Zixibacteria bacterium]|nr:peptide chain release factor 1 [candidate division Zixibacteria bacterium]
MIEIVEKLEKKLARIDNELIDPVVLSDRKKQIELNRERRHVSGVLEVGREYRRIKTGLDEAYAILEDGSDPELVAMAREELTAYESQIEAVEADFKLKLLPHDPTDDKPAVIEVRAGTGGDEAGLFAADIFRMYQRYAETKRWKMEILNSSEAGAGGFKEIIFSLDGDGVYGKMKYESGVHRVQRVPDTETQGRIHTSAVTVAVFPEAEEVEIEIKESDLKVDVYRSSGPGGQSVNTTDSAVRITHLPSGLVVTCQDEKSQLKNKIKALKVLRARLFDAILAERQAKIAAERKTMVSSGDRSAKIRTYNFPQSRVTDHRINLSLYSLTDVLGGNVDALIEPLAQHDREERLKFEAVK